MTEWDVGEPLMVPTRGDDGQPWPDRFDVRVSVGVDAALGFASLVIDGYKHTAVADVTVDEARQLIAMLQAAIERVVAA